MTAYANHHRAQMSHVRFHDAPWPWQARLGLVLVACAAFASLVVWASQAMTS